MVEEQKYPRLIWRLVLVVDLKNLKFLKIAAWFVIILAYTAPGTCYHGFIFYFAVMYYTITFICLYFNQTSIKKKRKISLDNILT